MKNIKKYIVLFALFIVPLLFYIFLSLGINNFAKLPVLTKNVVNVSAISKQHRFENRISIVTFLGTNIDEIKGEVFNLTEKIYKPFYDFKDFQLIVIVPKSSEEKVLKLQKEIAGFTNMAKWNFIFADEVEIKVLHESFNTNDVLDENLHTPNAYIIDKDVNLRGRTEDKDSADGKLFGYNMQSVSVLNKKMKDDVKVVLAEYRLALKKNNANREI